MSNLNSPILQSKNIHFAASLIVAIAVLLVVIRTNSEIKPGNYSEVKVFPNAQGFGTHSKAGRGGATCIVENTRDSGRGSLRYCLDLPMKRNVVFNVGGTITVESTLSIEQPHISIYGQTAIGDGIMIRGAPTFTGAVMRIATHDVLLQHVRVRAGPSTDPSCCRDALSIGNPSPNKVFNVIVDHSSLSWGTDEVIDIWYDSRDITVSRSIISEGLHNSTNNKGPAGRGFIIGSENSSNISVHNNLFAHNYQRNPLIKSPGVTDIVNNLIFHWVSRAAGVEDQYGVAKVNFVKNRYIALENSDAKQSSDLRWANIDLGQYGNGFEVYLEDNIGQFGRRLFRSQLDLLGIGLNNKDDEKQKYWVSKRHEAPKIDEVSASKLEHELLPNVGATLPKRDSTDSRIIRDVRNRTGDMPDCVSHDDPPNEIVCRNNVGGWPEYQSASPRLDSDRDGIPDNWEENNALNPNDYTDASLISTNGYSNLENWVHTLDK